MSKPKITPLASALKLIDQLSADEKQTLFDYLRPAPAPRKKSSKRAMQVKADPAQCAACGYHKDHPNHDPAYSSSHPFVSPSPAPGAGKRSSSKKGAETGSTANTGGQAENALAATGD